MKTFLYSILCLTVVILSGCSKDEKVTEFLKVTSGFTYTVDAVGGTVNVNVETNTDYFVSIPDDAKNWISVVGSRATMQDVFTLSVTANSATSRTAKISLKNKSGEVLANIQISQEVQTIKITDGATYEVDPKGETIDVNLETNTEYTVSIPDEAKDWISIVESRSTRPETVSLKIEANDDALRTAKISFVDKSGTTLASIQITQDVQEVKYLKITDGATYDIDPTGEIINVNLETNTEYMVSIPDEAKDWISVVESRSTRQETITLNISANTDKQRIAKLLFIEKSGETLASIQISQDLQSLKITNGMTYDVDPTGETINVNLETNTEYTVAIPEDAKDWISIVESRSMRQESVSLKIETNNDAPRTANVSFVNKFGESIAIIQISQEAQSFKITSGSINNVNGEGGNVNINIETNVDYSISIPDDAKDWIKVAESKQDVVTLQISKNEGEARSTVIQILDKKGNILTSIDISQEKGEKGPINPTEPAEPLTIPSDMTKAFPDEIFRRYVLNNFDTDRNGIISQEEAEKVRSINTFAWYGYEKIKSLDGIQYFPYLNFLRCGKCLLESINVSMNQRLTTLQCYGTQLTSLDVSKNTKLTELRCYNNQLTSLDVSGCTALIELHCENNPLMDGGNNQLTTLDVSGCKALKSLSCDYNQLTTLDVSMNTALTSLSCYNNQLTTLDVSGCTALTSLNCSNNKLHEINVSNNSALSSLYCSKNYLTDLDVTKNTSLRWLECNENELVALNVSNNTKLIELKCRYNQLTELDLPNTYTLEYLHCDNNQLTTLDVTNYYKLVVDHEDFGEYRLSCNMPTLKILYLKKGWVIPGINKFVETCPNYGGTHVYDHLINSNTSIVYK
ncbi:MAG: hypothetical protein K2H59_03915 [Muribaculaceae bacterium]|nr:hypothetical protein [Muribaculaceae bacterium]